MIAGLLVVALLVGREVVRSRSASRALGRMLVPAVIGLGLVAALRLVELSKEDADAVVAALVGVLLADGYEVKRTKGRQVQLRRGPDRVVLEVASSA